MSAEPSIRRIVLATGGTPGHVYPAVAVAEELLRRGGHEVLVVGTAHGSERSIASRAGLPFAAIPGSAYQRVDPARRLTSGVNLLRGVMAARTLLRRKPVDAVVGFGGYAAAGTVIAARTLGIWSALLEPNADAGKGNRIVQRFVDRVYLGLETQWPDPADTRLRRVGMPVRRAIIDVPRTEPSGLFRVLAFGDPFLERRVPELLDRVAGRISLRHARPADDVAAAYGDCDFVICRAGASTLAELSALAIPSLIVPLAAAAENHQTRNARPFGERDAAIVVSEAAWDVERLADLLNRLVSNPDELRAMSLNVRTLAAPNAARDLVDDLTSSSGP